MKTLPLVSCIIPTFNRANKVTNAIKSIQNQSYKNIEIIVVDDQSSDNTHKVVKDLMQNDNRIQYHLNPLKGANNARNYGIEQAKGSYIAFLDDDDVWVKDKTEKQVQFFNQLDENYGVVYCAFVRKTLTGKSKKRHPNKFSRIKNGNILPRMLKRNFIGTPTILVKSSVFEEVGTFNPKFSSFQDWELLTKIAAKYHFYYINEPLVISYESSDSITRNKHGRVITSIMHLKQFDDLYRKNPSILAKRYRNMAVKLLKYKRYHFAKILIGLSLQVNPYSISSYFIYLIIKILRL